MVFNIKYKYSISCPNCETSLTVSKWVPLEEHFCNPCSSRMLSQTQLVLYVIIGYIYLQNKRKKERKKERKERAELVNYLFSFNKIIKARRKV